MSNLLAFPMYAVNRADTDALWRAVHALLLARGVPAVSYTHLTLPTICSV